MSRILLLTFCLFLFTRTVAQEINYNYNQYVDPLIGTSRMGHTFPGATVPFGMVQLSPETDALQYELNGRYNKDVYKYCAGYQWTDQQWKTQERIRVILKHQYKPKPDGLGGNDDCGQMSAWYIFSTLGFYPVVPASGQYAIGSPSVKTATLQFENGKRLVIECKNQSNAAEETIINQRRSNERR